MSHETRIASVSLALILIYAAEVVMLFAILGNPLIVWMGMFMAIPFGLLIGWWVILGVEEDRP